MADSAAGTPTTDWRQLLGDSPELHDVFFTGTVTDPILIVLNKHQKLCIPATNICMCGARLDSSHGYRCHVREELMKVLVESGVLHVEYRETMNPETYAMNGPREQRLVSAWTEAA